MVEEKAIRGSIEKLRQDLRQDIKEIRKDTKEIPAIKQALLDLKENFKNHLAHHENISGFWYNFVSYIIGGVAIGLLIKVIILLSY